MVNYANENNRKNKNNVLKELFITHQEQVILTYSSITDCLVGEISPLKQPTNLYTSTEVDRGGASHHKLRGLKWATHFSMATPFGVAP